jgi:hypothetical protein
VKRADALIVLAAAGYHADTRSFVRVYVENRIGYAAAQAAWRRGMAARAAGVKCLCRDCVALEAAR